MRMSVEFILLKCSHNIRECFDHDGKYALILIMNLNTHTQYIYTYIYIYHMIYITHTYIKACIYVYLYLYISIIIMIIIIKQLTLSLLCEKSCDRILSYTGYYLPFRNINASVRLKISM